jgi:hypothetical protein
VTAGEAIHISGWRLPPPMIELRRPVERGMGDAAFDPESGRRIR